MALKNHLNFLLCKSLQELQEMVGEISPEEENILGQVKVNRFSEHWTFYELKNEATRLGKYVPETISRDGLMGLCGRTKFLSGLTTFSATEMRTCTIFVALLDLRLPSSPPIRFISQLLYIHNMEANRATLEEMGLQRRK